MNWYKGNIAEAVAQAKSRNAIFVVFVEGKDEATEKLKKFLDEQKIRVKLESDDFVAIKIESDSQAYMQFATIYQVVPIPSIFFIGKSGTPLDIGTGVIQSAEELEGKIDKALAASGKSTPASMSASSSFINAEQTALATDSKPAAKLPEAPAATAEPSTSAVSSKQKDKDSDIVCEGDVCYKRPKEESSTAVKTPEEQPVSTAQPPAEVDARLQETRKKLEQQRRERVEAEAKLAQEREMQRRRDGKDVQNLQSWQREQELKELKENRRRERMEDQAVRERIRAQIAADRAERAHKFSAAQEKAGLNEPTTPTNSTSPLNIPLSADSTRLQFRFGSGESAMHVFSAQDTLGMVRDYVRTELLPGTGIKEFSLATTYPKRELDIENDAQTLAELGLLPSAVILVIGRENSVNAASIIVRSGGLLNMLTSLFWTVLTPVFSLLGYFKNMVTGGDRPGRNAGANVGANKRANEDRDEQHEILKRRNLDRFGVSGNATGNSGGGGGGAGGSGTNHSEDGPDNGDGKPYRRYGGPNVHRLADNRKDSDDENATWNGNSTQQQ